ncbi:cysteine desulfurase [Candidatus Woesearchaeota archaeon]|nr:cysteine desulfurase [Candidatus Woesearchaeota archaeon]
MLNVEKIRKDFPILQRKVHGKPLVYLDSAASSQKPQQVIDAISHYYSTSHANIHRGIHQLGEEATTAYEEAHKHTAQFINAASWREIIFTKNTTESLNLLAYSLTKTFKKGDEIIVSRKEHHSNFVPWQQCAKQHGLVLKIVEITSDSAIDLEHLHTLLTKKTKIVSVTHMSNVLGTVNDVKHIAALVHANKTEDGGHTLLSVDGAQSVPHMPVDVQDLDCDFLSFSSHKMLGPTGIGVLYGKRALLEKMPPFLFGGGMVGSVTEQETSFGDLPWKFEAGTPHIAGAVGFSAALTYLEKLGMENVWQQEQELAAYALAQLKKQKDVTVYAPAFAKGKRGAVVSFTLGNIHAHDVISILDQEGIAVRAGHHCAQPLLDSMGVPATVRLSAYVYTTKEEIDALVAALDKVRKVFG